MTFLQDTAELLWMGLKLIHSILDCRSEATSSPKHGERDEREADARFPKQELEGSAGAIGNQHYRP